MRKKLLAMLLALAMIISVVPMMAMAEGTTDCDHMNNNWGYRSNNNGTHILYCADCNTVVETAVPCYDDGSHFCNQCKTNIPAAPAEDCDHTGNNWKYESNNGNGTHKVICKDCGTVVTESAECVWVNGKCVCGATQPTGCQHVDKKWVSNEDGTHTLTCQAATCGEKFETQNCNLIATAGGKCSLCGYQCAHVGTQEVVDNKDGKTHTALCSTCGAVADTNCAHVFTNGKCACGAVEPVTECTEHKFIATAGDGKCTVCGYVCDHTGVQTVVDNKDGKTHTALCPTCGTVTDTKCEHVYDAKTGKCACGAVKPAEKCDHVGVQTVVDNKDGKTHKTICPKCGEVVIEKSAHVYDAKTGKCACGAVKPAEKCDHVGVQTVVDNKDGKTHKTICPKCGEVVIEKSAHVYDAKTGKCACGAEKTTVKPTEPKPTEPKPTNPSKPSNNKNDKLDNVPKTGDNGSVILMSSLLITGLFGTAAYIVCTKKKVF